MFASKSALHIQAIHPCSHTVWCTSLYGPKSRIESPRNSWEVLPFSSGHFCFRVRMAVMKDTGSFTFSGSFSTSRPGGAFSFWTFGGGIPFGLPTCFAHAIHHHLPQFLARAHTSSPELVVTLKSKPTLQGLCDDLHCNSNVLLFLIFLEIF